MEVVYVKVLGSALVFLASGTLGAAFAVILVLLLPMDNGLVGLGARIANEAPVFVFSAIIGFVIGASIVLLWSALQWIFAACESS